MDEPYGGKQKMVFHLFGHVAAKDFPSWIERHARKLGIEYAFAATQPSMITIEAHGADEMLDAFALACSLGPQSVCVDRLQIVSEL
ncbi:MAG: acylphosphatase [Pseudomonadota bacterium]